ncbi:MAG: hypothetical protein ACK44Z_00180, partial [Pirellulaceae bacterium]
MAWLLRPKKSEAGHGEAVGAPVAVSSASAGGSGGNEEVVEAVGSAESSSSTPTELTQPVIAAVAKPLEEISEYIEDPKFVALKRELHQEVIAQLDPVA